MIKSPAPSEVAKWTVAIKWVRGDQAVRSKHLMQLLGALDMEKVYLEDQEFIRKEFQEGSLLGENKQCLRQFTNFLESKLYTQPQTPQRAAAGISGRKERRRCGTQNVRRTRSGGHVVVETITSSEGVGLDDSIPERRARRKRKCCRPTRIRNSSTETDTDESYENIHLCKAQRPVRSASNRSPPKQSSRAITIASGPEPGTSAANLNPPPVEPSPCLIYTEGTSMYSFNWKVH